MPAAGLLSVFIFSLVLCSDIVKISENRHLGRAFINGGGFGPDK